MEGAVSSGLGLRSLPGRRAIRLASPPASLLVPPGAGTLSSLLNTMVLPASEAFSPSLFLPSFSPPPFLLPPLLPPPPPLPCPWSGHMGGGGNFLRVCAVGFPRGAVPLITSQGTAPTIPPLMPRLICWGSGSRSSESQSWVEGALTVPFHRQGNRGQNSSPHISRNLLL